MSLRVPETYRATDPKRWGRYATTAADGNNGLFLIPMADTGDTLRVIVSDGADWEHASVSLAYRCPTWDEMCRVKELLWEPEDCVVQYHPPRSQYVNMHPHCLHLWRPLNARMPQPPAILVGF